MELVKKYYKLILLSIPVISLLLHWYVLKLDLVGIHVWRQTETQQMIDNFYRVDMNILNSRVNNMSYLGGVLRLEFPIMQWIFALFYKVFGPHIIISRLLSFVISLFCVYGIYHLAFRIFKNRATASVSAWCLAFSPVFYYYAINPMPDNFSLCFGVWSLCFFCDYISSNKIKYVILSAICFSLSVLSKLPFIIFGVFMAAYFFIELKQNRASVRQVFKMAVIYLLLLMPALIWYISVIPTWNYNVVLSGVFNISQSKAELLHIFSGILISVLPELLINYGAVGFFIAGFYFLFKNGVANKPYFLLCSILGITCILYVAFEINAITTIHDYYMFPVLPPLFLLIGYGASQMLLLKTSGFKVFAVICLVILPFTAFIRSYSRWDVTTDVGFNPVFYKYKEVIRTITPVNALCVVGDDQSNMVLLYYIDRKGWPYKDDELDEATLFSYIKQGATYLYVTGSIDRVDGIKRHLERKIFEIETLRVYKLK